MGNHQEWSIKGVGCCCLFLNFNNGLKFIYDILSHIVKLFTLYSNTVSQTKITPELQTSILKYTAGAIYRLISILHEDVDQLREKINKSKSECDEMITVKRKVEEKILTFEESLKTQNEKIDKIIENMGKVNQETNKLPPYISFLFGGISGSMAWLFIYPQDRIKTIIQASNENNKKTSVVLSEESNKKKQIISNIKTNYLYNNAFLYCFNFILMNYYQI